MRKTMWRGIAPVEPSLLNQDKETSMRTSFYIALLALTNLAGTAFATIHEVPLMKAAGGFQQGFVRVATFEVGGEVRIEAWDDAGHFAETTLTVSRNSVQGFNSEDLQSGNANKGMPEGIGSPTVGDWRLRLSAGFDFDVNAYVRTGDGFVTSVDSLHRVPGNAGSTEIDFFNPGSNYNQVSGLRIINEKEEESAEVTIRGTEDRPSEKDRNLPLFSARPAFTVSVPPLSAVYVTASDLEGEIGDGDGKWRLKVTSELPVTLVNLLETPTGHLTNFGHSAEDPACFGRSSSSRGLPAGELLGGEESRAISRAHADLRNTVWRYADLQQGSFEESDLRSARFYSANLSFANLSRATLTGASFSRANLSGADFSGSHLDGTRFYFADLNRANLSSVIYGGGSEFEGAVLCDADLTGADLRRDRFQFVVLRRAKANRANLDGAYLLGADLSSADFRQVGLEGATLENADLTRTDLTDSDLERANLTDAVLIQAQLDDANLERASLHWANLSNATARNADLQSANLRLAVLTRTDFSNSDLSKSDLGFANLAGGNFRNADFREARLDHTNFTGANLQGADLRDLDFCNSWTGDIQVDDETRTEGSQCFPD